MLQRNGIDAVTKAAWLRPVRKHMTKVRSTVFTDHFLAVHAIRSVFFFHHFASFGRRRKARPATTRIKLFFGRKKFFAANRATVKARFLKLVIQPGKRRFRTFFLRHSVGLFA